VEFDFKTALNAISNVVQNRPPPLREFDQIYMKVGDLLVQAEFISRKFNGLDVIFIGDGDSVGLSVTHLHQAGLFSMGPKHITVLDFDERIVNSINSFACTMEMELRITAELYNVVDPLPYQHRNKHEAFYTNPPWGASNDGVSVAAFVNRGIEALGSNGIGSVVIADDEDKPWAEQVLYNTEKLLIDRGFVISEMIPNLHEYHLDDEPDLRSCCILARCMGSHPGIVDSKPLPIEDRNNFYGKHDPLRYRYVREIPTLNRGRAPDGTYKLEPLENVE